MVITAAEIRARRSLSIWIIVSFFSLFAEIVIITLISLNIESLDLVPLKQEHARLSTLYNAKNSHPTENSKGTSLPAIIKRIIPLLSPETRFAKIEITESNAQITVEAKTAKALDETVQQILISNSKEPITLVSRIDQENAHTATISMVDIY